MKEEDSLGKKNIGDVTQEELDHQLELVKGKIHKLFEKVFYEPEKNNQEPEEDS